MSRTYHATGINLKSMPLGETDRLLTVLTREHGLIRVVAPGARKHNSKLGGRSDLFVVNELLISKGRSLDKISQAETLESYPGLSKDLAKLTASQYLAELVLCQALSSQPQEELFCLFNEHLGRLERLSNPTKLADTTSSLTVLAHLAQATFHLLALAGIAPQVQTCCVTQRPLTPDLTDDGWRIGFSLAAGGTVDLAELGSAAPIRLHQARPTVSQSSALATLPVQRASTVTEASAYLSSAPAPKPSLLQTKLNALELALLQQLAQPELLELDALSPELEQNAFSASTYHATWLRVERLLRQYAQYHFDRPIRSAALIDTCFSPVPTAP